MSTITFTADELDQFREIVNIAMGQAGSKLAGLFEDFVELLVPEISIVPAAKIAEVVATDDEVDDVDEVDTIFAVMQHFSNIAGLDGEAFMILDQHAAEVTAALLGLEDFPTASDTISNTDSEIPVSDTNPGIIDLVLELHNILVGACLSSISEQLFQKEMAYESPNLLDQNLTLRELAYNRFKRSEIGLDQTLIVKITFTLESGSIQCTLLVFFAENAIDAIREAVAALIQEIDDG